MADTLVIFGETYSNVAGIIATDSNGNELTYSRGGGGTPSLQTKSKTYTPTTSQQTESVTADSGYDGLSSVNVTVNAIPSQYIVPSGTISITENGTGIDVSSYASANVSVSGSAPSLQSKSVSYTPSESAQGGTVTADNGYDGLSSVEVSVGAVSSTYVGSDITRRTSSNLTASGATVTAPAGYYASQATKSVTSGTAGTPTATKGTVSNHSVSITPSVTNTTGYITGGTKTGTAVTVSASELVSGNRAITSNGTNIDVTNYETVSVDVPTGGGGGMNIQAYHGMDYARASSYTATDVTLTVAVSGTYKVSWMGFRNTNSGTNGSQLYKNGSAVGSAHTTFTSTYGQYCEETLSFSAGDVLVVRARARSSSYYMYVGNLIIEQTA